LPGHFAPNERGQEPHRDKQNNIANNIKGRNKPAVIAAQVWPNGFEWYKVGRACAMVGKLKPHMAYCNQLYLKHQQPDKQRAIGDEKACRY